MICACNQCNFVTISRYCATNVACYRRIDSIKCARTGGVCYGCLTNKSQLLHCDKQTHANSAQIQCCHNFDLCNMNMTSDDRQVQTTSRIDEVFSIVSLTVALVSICILIILASAIVFGHLSRKKEDKARFRKLTGTRRVLGSIQPSQANTQNTVRFDVKSFANDEASVTSGCGPDELVQRTIWRDIHIDEASGPIGNGRFGSVWRASWQDEPVAVKLFNSLHEASWSRETDIYQTSMLRHENILGYIASDIRGGTSPASLMFMIVTDLHPLGSLYDFLLANTLNTRQLLAFLSGVASGLSHLHQEIVGVKYKPSVAHRDLKTKNVLVKAAASGRCCLADFGSAVCDWSTPLSRVNSVDWKQQSVVYGNNVWQQQQGSVRYMAPECLSGALGGANQATTTIEDFKCVDMYAFALVVWELLTRTRFTGSDHDQTSLVVVAHEHRPPYSEYVSGDPPLELMRHLVCDKQMRPATERIDELVAQSSNQDLNTLVDMMKECWKETPSSRLTALNVKKKLNKMNMLTESES